MLTSIAVSSINHILHGESWARKRLQVYTGKTVCIRLFPFPDFSFSIQVDGEISAVPNGSRVDTVMTLTPALLLRIRANNSDDTVFDEIDICGDGALAKELFIIGRHLHWDLEQDLSGITGDILSHRIVHSGENIILWQIENMQNLSNALVEYWTEEQPMLASHTFVSEFNREVETLYYDTEQLERRIQKLTHHEW